MDNVKTPTLIQAVRDRNLKKVQELLANPETNVNAKGSNGLTALEWADINEEEKIVKLLLEHKDIDKNQALLMAAKRDLIDIVTKHLKAGADINSCVAALEFLDEHGYKENYKKIVNLLLDRVLEDKDIDKNKILIFATRSGNVDVTRKLLESGANVNATNKYGTTALESAFDKDVIKLLSERKDIDTTEVLKKAEDVYFRLKDDNEYSVIVLKKLQDAVKMIESGKSFDVNLALKVLSSYGDKANFISKEEQINILKILSNQKGIDMNACLHLAIRYHSIDVVKNLIERGADVNERDSAFGETPLIAAVLCNDPSIVSELLKHPKIDITIKGDVGTALDMAQKRHKVYTKYNAEVRHKADTSKATRDEAESMLAKSELILNNVQDAVKAHKAEKGSFVQRLFGGAEKSKDKGQESAVAR